MNYLKGEGIEMRKLISLLTLATLILSLVACGASPANSGAVVLAADTPGEIQANVAVDVAAQEDTQVTLDPITVEYDQDDLDASASSTEVTTIELAGDAITVEGSGAAVDGTVVTITAAGTYNISGVLNDGQIVVDTADAETVVLVLNGADITSLSSAPIYVKNAEKTVIALAEGTVNSVTDSDLYVFEDPASDEPNAAIFSHDDLTINGDGALTVTGNYNNGIASKDDLKITGGNITVNALNDGIKGKDSIAVLDGTITIIAVSDGLQATNIEDSEKGYIAIEGGTLNVTAGLDAIQAETSLLVSGGDLTLTSGVGSGNSAADSTKGLKAGVDVTISGGNLVIDAPDDAIHSNNTLTIDGGSIAVTSNDDGIHADTSLVINDGTLDIAQSYEGLESRIIIINGGTVHITSSDDGINVSDGSGGGMMGGGPMEMVATGYYLEINGGYLYVDAGGDGLDSNGTGTLNDGIVIVNGPTNNGNGSLDVGGNLVVNGGFLVAVGSAGMAQSPSTASTQYSALINLQGTLPAGSIVHIESEDGEDILTFAPTKAYQTVVISSPEMENGATYVVYAGGQATGTVTDGLYTDGTYSAGTQVSSFTIASIVTGESTGMGGPGGMPGGGRPRP
jgi:hypothetical protein